MNGSVAKIRAMMAAGTISKGEGRELLAALRERKSFTFAWLWDPFRVVQPTTALGMGLAISLASVCVGVFFAVRFGSVLSVQMTPVDVPWFVGMRDQLVAWPLAAVVFWGCAKLAKSGGRLRDVVAYLGLARLPQLVLALVGVLVVQDRAQLSRISQDVVQAFEHQAQGSGQVLGLGSAWLLTLLAVLSIPLL